MFIRMSILITRLTLGFTIVNHSIYAKAWYLLR